MMFPPNFIATSIGESTPQGTNAWGGSNQPMWKVSLVHSFYASEFVDLYFPTEGEARTFSQWKTYTPKDILEKSGDAKSNFNLGTVEKTKRAGPTNKFTDQPTTIDLWRASLENTTDGRIFQFSFPTEKETRTKFTPGKAYSLQSILGTVPSVPQGVTESYLFAAEQAVEKAAAAEQSAHDLYLAKIRKSEAAEKAAQGEAKAASQQIAASQGKYTTAQSALAAAQSKKAAALAKLNADPFNSTLSVAYINASKEAEQAESAAGGVQAEIATYQQKLTAAQAQAVNASQVAAQLAKGQNRRTVPSAVNTYTISDGGAEGTYNNVYYKAGTFTVKNGQWTGIFVPKK